MLSVILFAASLRQDAFCVSGICSDWQGWSILLFGALGHTSWFANPLLLASWIAALFARRRPALVLSLAALGLAGSFMFETSVITNEAGMANPVTGLREGYWLWLASMGAGVCAAFFARKVPVKL
ncbi:MAG: putative lipoprotein [Rhodospirillaceae bacterium]|nr:MAG: putative lipoprotein [Rhodospirillaceae bacterium]